MSEDINVIKKLKGKERTRTLHEIVFKSESTKATFRKWDDGELTLSLKIKNDTGEGRIYLFLPPDEHTRLRNFLNHDTALAEKEGEK